jgi:E3 ubiquitin-protein ligase TRIP12
MTYRSTPGKGKAASKSKAMAATVPSTSHADDEDIEMLDADYIHDELHDATARQGDDGDDEDDDDLIEDTAGHNDDSEHDDDDDEPEEPRAERGLGGADDSAPLSMFGDYRHLGSYMLGLSSRLKTMLNNIKRTADPTTRLLTLQELSELLSISTEDTLAGSFPVESFVRELVRILGGTGNDPEGEEEEEVEQDEDAALAAALALSTGGAFQGDENLEAQVLACRCLANLMEALPGVAHTVVYHGAIPVLCSKLIEISYIDLAEQTLSVSFVCILLFQREWFHMSLSDLGEDIGRVPKFNCSGRWLGRSP